MVMKNDRMVSDGPVAQWIEQLRPKEKVVRSTRSWATRRNGVLGDVFFYGEFFGAVETRCFL